MPKATVLRFFLGANSSQGFVSRFDQLGDPKDHWRCTIIKGGPGTGKSSLMRRLSAVMAEKCPVIEEIYCSSDVNSLDGIILPSLRLSIADGTPPHGGRTEAHKCAMLPRHVARLRAVIRSLCSLNVR